MTSGNILATQFSPELFNSFAPPKTEGAGNAGCTLHPRSRVPYAQAEEGAHEHTGQRRQSDIPCAMVLRLTSCSPRRGGLVVTVIPEKRQLLENLTPASRRQDHTTWP